MINRTIIDENILNKFDNEMFKFINFIILIKVLVPKYVFKNIIKDFRCLLINMSIKNNQIDLIIKYIINYNNDIVMVTNGKIVLSDKGNNNIVDLFYKLLSLASIKKINLNDALLDKLLNLIKNVYDINIPVIINLSNKIINNYLIDRLDKIAKNNKFKTVSSRKHSGREKEWSHNMYEKEFNNILSSTIKLINYEIIKWLSLDTNIKVNDMLSHTAIIENIILNLNTNFAQFIYKNSDINIVLSKKEVISKVKKLDDENIKYFTKDFNRDLNEFSKVIQDIEDMNILDTKMDKLSSLNTPLLKSVKDIIDSNLSNYDKQVAIETVLIEYELDFFNKHVDTPEARNQILHKIYPKFKKGYDRLIKDYSINNYYKLRKEINNIKFKNIESLNKEHYISIIILMIMYIGTDKCIFLFIFTNYKFIK